MSESTKKEPESKSPAAAGTRRPYEKPRIVSREKIEGRANVCDPLAGGKASKPSCNILRS